LLVDDDQVALAAVGKLLGRLTYRVTPCADSAEAVKLAVKGDWDVIVLDLGLPSPNPERVPDFSGFKILRWLTFLNRRIPVIIFTANGSDGVDAQALTAGAFAVVQKSEPPKKLAETVQLALESRPLVQTLARVEAPKTSTSTETGFTSVTRFFNRLREHAPALLIGTPRPRS
jgi:CheY-like chemotaxis protein